MKHINNNPSKEDKKLICPNCGKAIDRLYCNRTIYINVGCVYNLTKRSGDLATTYAFIKDESTENEDPPMEDKGYSSFNCPECGNELTEEEITKKYEIID
jgi:predicted RNA-binding Zn-ribbon protein involved in translation (DUF1610 family)